MVKKTKRNGKEAHQCEECGFYYAQKKLAQQCEDWCRTHKSCNTQITAHAIQ